ncbi:hypothetical protein [Mesorhizobium sp. ORS 3428]|nr:hypothetical protein [Mesorhizobium sp. ORS 3428]
MDRGVDIAWFLLQLIPQSPLVSILTNGGQDAFAHGRIDILGTEQLG